MSNENEPLGFVKEWEQAKKTINELSSIVIGQNEAIVQLDSLLSQQTTHLNTTLSMLNAQQKQVNSLSETVMAMLEIHYGKGKITKESMQAKIIQFSVDNAKLSVEESLKNNKIKPTEITTENTLVVYKTKEIEYAISSVTDLNKDVIGKKVGEKITVQYLSEDQKIVDQEAEIIALFDSVK